MLLREAKIRGSKDALKSLGLSVCLGSKSHATPQGLHREVEKEQRDRLRTLPAGAGNGKQALSSYEVRKDLPEANRGHETRAKRVTGIQLDRWMGNWSLQG